MVQKAGRGQDKVTARSTTVVQRNYNPYKRLISARWSFKSTRADPLSPICFKLVFSIVRTHLPG